jgi:hypothetical protein
MAMGQMQTIELNGNAQFNSIEQKLFDLGGHL